MRYMAPFLTFLRVVVFPCVSVCVLDSVGTQCVPCGHACGGHKICYM